MLPEFRLDKYCTFLVCVSPFCLWSVKYIALCCFCTLQPCIANNILYAPFLYKSLSGVWKCFSLLLEALEKVWGPDLSLHFAQANSAVSNSWPHIIKWYVFDALCLWMLTCSLPSCDSSSSQVLPRPKRNTTKKEHGFRATVLWDRNTMTQAWIIKRLKQLLRNRSRKELKLICVSEWQNFIINSSYYAITTLACHEEPTDFLSAIRCR